MATDDAAPAATTQPTEPPEPRADAKPQPKADAKREEPKADQPKAKRDKHALPEPVADVELVYLGDAGGVAHVPGVPAYHLTERDIDRVVYRQTVHRDVPDPDDPDEFIHIDAGLQPGDDEFDKARTELVTQLVASGHYRRA